MTYEDVIISLVRLQRDSKLTIRKDMDIHIRPTFTRVDIRDRYIGSVRTIIFERTSNFTDLLGAVICELKTNTL